MTYTERLETARWYCLLATICWHRQRSLSEHLIDSAACALAGVDDPDGDEDELDEPAYSPRRVSR
jgi:hypothetical protein